MLVGLETFCWCNSPTTAARAHLRHDVGRAQLSGGGRGNRRGSRGQRGARTRRDGTTAAVVGQRRAGRLVGDVRSAELRAGDGDDRRLVAGRAELRRVLRPDKLSADDLLGASQSPSRWPGCRGCLTYLFAERSARPLLIIALQDHPAPHAVQGVRARMPHTTFPWVFFIMLFTLFFIKNFVNSKYGRSCIVARK